MITIKLALILFALIAFLLATFNAPTRINLIALGLSFATAAWLLSEMSVVA